MTDRLTNVELVRIGGMNAAGRVSDLRRHHQRRIVVERIKDGPCGNTR